MFAFTVDHPDCAATFSLH